MFLLSFLLFLGIRLSAAAIDTAIDKGWEETKDDLFYDRMFLGYDNEIPLNQEQVSPKKVTVKEDTIRVYVIPLLNRSTLNERMYGCAKVSPEYPTAQHLLSLNGSYYGEKTIWVTPPKYHLHSDALLTFYEGSSRLEQNVRYALKSGFNLIIENWSPIYWQDMVPIKDKPQQFTWQFAPGFREYTYTEIPKNHQQVAYHVGKPSKIERLWRKKGNKHLQILSPLREIKKSRFSLRFFCSRN